MIISRATITPNPAPRPPRGRARPVLLTAACVVAITACGASDDTASDSSGSASPTPAATRTVAATTAPSSTATSVAEPPVTGPTTNPPTSVDAVAVPEFYSFAEPGTYTIGQLGVPITMTVSTDYFVTGLGPGFATFIEWDSDEPLPSAGDPLRSIWFERIGSFYDRAESVDTTHAGLGSIDPYDIDAWAADNAVLTDRVGTTTVGGRSARTLDARPDPDAGVTGPCLPEFTPCVWVSTLSASVVDSTEHHSPKYPLGSGFVARMWLVDMDGFEPVLVRINAPDDDLAWLDEFEATVLPSITFGEPRALSAD